MKTILALILVGASISLFAGGGWPQKKGEGYFKFGQAMIRAQDFYGNDSKTVKIPTISYYATYLYGEYGVTDRITTVGYFPLMTRVTLNKEKDLNTGELVSDGDELTSFGDFTLGVKYGIIPKGKVVWSAQLDFKLPTGKETGGSTGILQTGDGAFSQLIKTEVSTTKGSFYFTGMLGVRHRGDNYSDDWHSGLEVGWNKKQKFYAILKMNSVKSFENNNEVGTGQTLFGNNVEYVAIGPEFHYFFDNNWGVSGSVTGAFSGRNVLASPNIGIGISYNLKKSDS